jgi:hypothetical protein
MGFYDDVTLESGCQECGIPQGSTLQTKSLYAGGGVFTITWDGELVEQLRHYEDDPTRLNPVTGWPLPRRVLDGRRVIAYHGDILLSCVRADDRHRELVARVTHGQLEWIRPVADYPEENRMLLVQQGAR